MSDHKSTYVPGTGFEKWLDTRLPIIRLVSDSFVDFPTPKNLNYWYTFGGILAFCLATQILTGVVLAMHYTPSIDGSFALWLALALYPRQWRVHVLPCGLYSHDPRALLRVL